MEDISFLTLILAWSAQISESIFYVLTPVTFKYRSLRPIVELDLAPPDINILCKNGDPAAIFLDARAYARSVAAGLTSDLDLDQRSKTNVSY